MLGGGGVQVNVGGGGCKTCWGGGGGGGARMKLGGGVRTPQKIRQCNKYFDYTLNDNYLKISEQEKELGILT